MFHYIPTSNLQSRFPNDASSYLPRPQPLSPREKYLAAIAEAKAAEAEYLAALAREQAVQREKEEEARRQESLLRRESLLDSFYPSHGFIPRQYDDDEIIRLALARRQQQQQEEEQKRRIALALLAQKEREDEERRRILALQEEQRVRQLREVHLFTIVVFTFLIMYPYQAALKSCCQPQSQSRAEVNGLQQLLELFVNGQPQVKAPFDRKQRTHKDCHGPCSRPKSSPERQGQDTDTDIGRLLNILLGQQEIEQVSLKVLDLCFSSRADGRNIRFKVKLHPQSRAAPASQIPAPSSVPVSEPVQDESQVDLQQILNLFLGAKDRSLPQNPRPAPVPAPTPKVEGPKPQTPTSRSSPSPAPSNHVIDLQQFLNLLAGGDRSAPAEKDAQVPKGIQQMLNLVFGATQGPEAPSSASASTSSAVDKKDQPQPAAVSSQTPAVAAPIPTPSSLKQELESRLNNEYEVEVRDTIQALLASLSPESSTKSDPKGKGKATEPSAPTPALPTSTNIQKSMTEVRNIETAFNTLSSSFVFPSKLDFAPESSSNSSAQSSESESSSATLHLAFTARNQPIRFYEQALGALLTKLDSVDSFGNEALRGRRKEVVSLVEKALEELEREVEGRFKLMVKRLSKEAALVATSKTSSTTTTTAPKSSESLPAPVNIPIVDGTTNETSEEPIVVAANPEPEVVEVPSHDSESSIPVEVATTESELISSVDSTVVTTPSGSSIDPTVEVPAPIEPPVVDNDDTPTADTTTAKDVSETPNIPDAVVEVEEATEISSNPEPPSSSYPPSVSVSVSTPSSPNPLSSSSSESVDTFLLPASSSPEVPAKKSPKPTVTEEEDWSEVEA